MNIAIIGYGKMGKTIHALLSANTKHEVVLCIDSKNAADLNAANLQGIDVAIEFTRPDHAVKNISTCLENGLRVVSGTTGWLNQWDKVVDICHSHKTALLYTSNFSIGVNLFFKLNGYLAKLMQKYPNYNLHITEIHHTQKLDAPSGTAISIANDICATNDNYKAWHLQNDATDNDSATSIPIVAVRKESTVGTHIVDYSNEIDSISISHLAKNRNGFAQGAILAAEWLQDKTGVFSMQDVLFGNDK